MSNESVRYTEEHEWIKLVDLKTGLIGISAHAAEELGEIVFVDLAEKGHRIEKGKEFGSVESVKTVSGLYAPVSGKIIEVNQDVIDSPEIVNKSPEGDGWLVTVALDDPEEITDLMTESDYKVFLESL